MATGRIGTNTVLTTRWSKAPAGGTTSLSGLDDASVSLVYSVGYEQVYRNGVLLSRGNDYTATNGTTITLIDATITGDIIEVFANATIPLTDTYSQTVANGKFINNTLTTTTGDIIYASAANTPARLGIGSTDQVLKVTGGVPAWAAPSSPTFTSYTPSWTNLTVGNGTVTAVSATNGDLVSVVVKIVFGSTTSVSGTPIKYSLPSTAHSSIYLCEFPGGLMLDSGSYYTECHTQIFDSGTNGGIVWNNINEGATTQNFPVQSNTSSTLPWTWANGDQIVSAFTYRKA